MARSREEQREYMREYRARKRAEGVAENVTSIKGRRRPVRVVERESVEDAVRAELDLLGAAVSFPGLVAVALAHARVLDDPASVSQHASNGRALSALLVELRGSAQPVANKLAQMRARRVQGAG